MVLLINQEWENCATHLQILKPFYKITKYLGFYYPTTLKLMVEIFSIVAMFDNYEQDDFWRPLILFMEEKFLN